MEPATLAFEAVEEIVYLGSIIHHDGRTNPEMNARITSGAIAYGKLKRQMGTGKNELKVWLYDVFVSTRLFFAVETWAQTKAQTAKLNSIRMNNIRTLTNQWDHGDLKDAEKRSKKCDVQSRCKLCTSTGTAHFWYMRKFLQTINAMRNRRILTHTYTLYVLLRQHRITGTNMKQTITTIFEFAGLGLPNWLTHWLPKPSNSAIQKHWDLPSTESMLAKRRANLLGSLLRHAALPMFTSNAGRAGWWKTVNVSMGTMKLNLEDAHDVTFWRNAVRKASKELDNAEP